MLYECGVLFICFRACQSLLPDKRTAPHFLFLTAPPEPGRTQTHIMKKLFTLSAALLLGVSVASAQNIHDMFGKDQKGEIGYGVRAGLNISGISGEHANGKSLDYKSRAGFQIGAVVDIPLFNGFYIQPGLFFTTRGAKEKLEEYGYKETTKLHPMYLQIPVLASFRADVSRSVNVQVNVGPHFALGLGGKAIYEFSDDPTNKIPFFGLSSENDPRFDAKRFDFGLSFGAGVTIKKHYYVGIQYDLGLMNMAIHDKEWGYPDGTKFHNGNFAIQVGYNF